MSTTCLSYAAVAHRACGGDSYRPWLRAYSKASDGDGRASGEFMTGTRRSRADLFGSSHSLRCREHSTRCHCCRTRPTLLMVRTGGRPHHTDSRMTLVPARADI